MFIRIVAEKHNVLFECTRVVELEDRINFFTGLQGDVIHTELMFGKEKEELRVFAMNNQGKTIDSWTINPAD
ncbi:MAG: hypothetical protein KAJ19_06515 [Gammaproteobacteria bacterium]|nr:hypothetical protein [Gammaproteobacteria bacterium]